MPSTPRSSRRWSRPRARTDLFFRRSGTGWDLTSEDGSVHHSLAFREAVLWTYCDGRHDLQQLSALVRGLPGAADEDVQGWVAGALGRLQAQDLLS